MKSKDFGNILDEYNDISEKPYQIHLKHISAENRCCYCGRRDCKGCPLPFSDDKTLNTYLTKLDLETNQYLYTRTGKKDLSLEVIWNSAIPPEFFKVFMLTEPWPTEYQQEK